MDTHGSASATPAGLPPRAVVAAVQILGLLAALAGVVLIAAGDPAGFAGVVLVLGFVTRTVRGGPAPPGGPSASAKAPTDC